MVEVGKYGRMDEKSEELYHGFLFLLEHRMDIGGCERLGMTQWTWRLSEEVLCGLSFLSQWSATYLMQT